VLPLFSPEEFECVVQNEFLSSGGQFRERQREKEPEEQKEEEEEGEEEKEEEEKEEEEKLMALLYLPPFACDLSARNYS